jgi:hypothetical protein
MTSQTYPAESSQAVSVEDIKAIALTLDALVGRLSYDNDFVKDLASNPRQTLKDAGLELAKEPLEAYIKSDPERFDKASEALFARVDSDFLMTLSAPSCD